MQEPAADMPRSETYKEAEKRCRKRMINGHLVTLPQHLDRYLINATMLNAEDQPTTMTSRSTPTYFDHGGYHHNTDGSFHEAAASSSKISLADYEFLHQKRPSPALTAEEKRENHNENERIRRKGFNGHIETFRHLFPYLNKKDKASVLGEVVRRVRELSKTAASLRTAFGSSIDSAAIQGGGHDVIGTNAMGILLLPDDTDNVNVSRSDADSRIVMATLSCDDKVTLIPDLIRAISSVKGRVVKVEMATVGGRVKASLWVQLVAEDDGGAKDEALMALQRTLKEVVDMDKTCLLISKRQRAFY